MDEWMQVHQLNGAYLIGCDARWLGITLPLTPFTGQHLREQASERAPESMDPRPRAHMFTTTWGPLPFLQGGGGGGEEVVRICWPVSFPLLYLLFYTRTVREHVFTFCGLRLGRPAAAAGRASRHSATGPYVNSHQSWLSQMASVVVVVFQIERPRPNFFIS